jgi:hypothetical protein
MKLNKKIYLLVSIFSVFVFLLLFFIIFLLKEIKKQSQDLLTLREKVFEKEIQLKNIQNLKLVEKEIDLALERVNRVFFKKEAPIDFINFLDEISQNCQISVERLSFLQSPKTQSSNFSRIDFQITGISNFKGAFCFLKKIEFGPYLVQVLDLNLSKLREEELKLNIVFSVLTQ